MIRVRDITLPFDHQPEALKRKVLNYLHISEQELICFNIVRKAIDARRKAHIMVVYTLDIQVVHEPELLSNCSQDPTVTPAPQMTYQPPDMGAPSAKCPVIVGSGPCGLMAALLLAQWGHKPVLIERGKDVGARVRDVQAFWSQGTLDPCSNVQFGEGGAGTFSDGKLTTQIKDRHNRGRKVLEELVKAGAEEDILYQAKPHLGTDQLVTIVRNIRHAILSLGGQVRFETKLTGIVIHKGCVTGAIVNDTELIETDTLVLAIGHSARDTFEMLHRQGIPIEPKPFSIGVRIEHLQSMIDKAQYGSYAGHPLLGSADYKLACHASNGRSAYTFCMCPGGEVIAAASEPGGVVTNGMSQHARSCPNANSALLVGIDARDFGNPNPLAGVEFQRTWEHKAFEVGGSNYFAPVQRVGDFLTGRPSLSLGVVVPSYTPGTTPCDLAECLPGFVVETLRLAIPQMANSLKGFAMPDAIMTALESRSSSPVRILRDDTFQSSVLRGLYPAGEGAGYAGGIMSSAIDGIKIAEAIKASR